MNKTQFESRRRRIMSQMAPASIAVIPAAPERTRNRDVNHPFRQDSDFHYLTGFAEPQSVAVLAPGRGEGEFILFCRDRDSLMETWNGRRAGQEGAVSDYGADAAYSISEIDELLPGLLENRERVYYAVGCNADFDQSMMRWLNIVRGRARAGVTAPREFVSFDHLLHEMRLRKSPEEIAIMRRAGEIAAEAHCCAMRSTRPGMYEYQVEAEILRIFRQNGCVPSYPSIVGGGANGCILHYTENNAPLRDGDLLLIDAGAELECYASDITRTFPVGGRFSGEQRALYDVVLSAQLAAIQEVRPGNCWNAPHEAAVRVLTQGLVDVGILRGDVDALAEEQKYKPFYMHRTGHWLGMDVHDVGEYKVDGKWRSFEPGMVTTVEPGLYIAASASQVEGSEVDERWWNIGIRIEDDVVVTEAGNEVLSRTVPKTANEVETLMHDGRA